MNLDAMIYSRGASFVTRYHSVPTIRQTNIAEHSFNVINLVLYLTRGNASNALIRVALLHDIAEVTTGDIPAPLKRVTNIKADLEDFERDLHQEHEFPHVSELSEEEQIILKYADCYEGLLYTLEECDMGNKMILPVMKRWVEYLHNMTPPESIVQTALDLSRYVDYRVSKI